MSSTLTALEIVNVPKELLIEWGIYPNKAENKAGNLKLNTIFVTTKSIYFNLPLSL